MADKMAAACQLASICHYGHSNLVIFNRIFPNFTAYQFTFIRCCGHSNLVILIGLFPNFIYGLLSSNPGSSSNMSFARQTITKMADKMAAACQLASICHCGHSNLVIFNRIFPNFIYGLFPSNPGSSSNISRIYA